MAREARYILTIDGGGIRGIIPGRMLKELNRLVRGYGDKRPLYAHFDLIAGTSTGALLALALAAPEGGLPREDILPYAVYRKTGFFHRRLKGLVMPGTDPEALEGLYEEYGPKIFPSAFYSKSLLYPLFSEKYDSLPFEAVLYSWFGDTPMSELLAPVMAVCYEPAKGRIRTLKSWEDKEVLIREAAYASSAAPTYFPPKEIADGSVLIDGGIAANNPVLLAYAAARRLYPDAEEFQVLSLSTCSESLRYDPREGTGGIAGWAYPVIKLYGDASAEVAEETAEAIPGLNCVRIWSEPGKRVKLDSTKEDDIAFLKDLAGKTYEENSGKLRSYAAKLAKRELPERIRLRAPGEAPPLSDEGRPSTP